MDSKLSADSKKIFTEVAWHKISEYRNKIVNDYFGFVDFEGIWHVVTNKLPLLKQELETALTNHYK